MSTHAHNTPLGNSVNATFIACLSSQQIEVTKEGASVVADALKRLLKADQQLLVGRSVGEQHILLELLRKVRARRP